MQNHTISPLQGTAAGLLACAIWSPAILAMNVIGAAFGPLRAVGLELSIAGVVLFLSSWIRGDLKGILLHSYRCHLVCGSFWILNFTLSWLAVSFVHSSGELLVTGLLNYLWPSLTLLLAIPILGKRATWPLIPGLVAVFIGLLIAKLATAPSGEFWEAITHLNPWAYSLAVLDALAWALYSNYSRKLSNPKGASAVPAYMLVGGILLLIISARIEVPSSPLASQWVLLIGWSLGSALAYLFWDVGMRFGNVVTISTTSMFIPLLSTIITAAASGHGLTPTLVVAAALVVAGSALCRRGVR
jgi:drug/metabolite transporter (DMT)-like permease